MFIKLITALLMAILTFSASAFEFKGTDTALPSKEAFKVFVERSDNNITIIFDIEKNYYLYKDKIEFLVDDKKIETKMPNGFIKNDSYFGKVEVYPLDFKVELNNEFFYDAKTLTIKHQGCAEVYDLCYVPRIDVFKI